MAGEYQFSLIDVTKQVGAKTILKDVNLSFFYGAHIGVIGGNGAGKSSLLKILAGLDTDLIGTVQVAKTVVGPARICSPDGESESPTTAPPISGRRKL